MIEDGGFVLAHWDGTDHTEQKIKKETKATIRCIDDTFSDERFVLYLVKNLSN